jgi:hypothetical protein
MAREFSLHGRAAKMVAPGSSVAALRTSSDSVVIRRSSQTFELTQPVIGRVDRSSRLHSARRADDGAQRPGVGSSGTAAR